jgi:hypothetical protein
VRRESHAPFCERPKVQSLRPTLLQLACLAQREEKVLTFAWEKPMQLGTLQATIIPQLDC